MSVLAITPYSGKPHVFFRDTDKAALVARSQSDRGRYPWNAWWANKLLPYVAPLYSEESFSSTASLMHVKLMTYCLAAYLLDSQAYADQALGHARYFAQNKAADAGQVTNLGISGRRGAILGLCAVYDILHTRSTDSDRAIIGGAIYRIMQGFPTSTTDLMDGHARIDYSMKVIGALTLLNETGAGYNFGAGGDDVGVFLTAAIDFLYGGNVAATTNGYAALGTDRFYQANGGAGKGVWYQFLSNWGIFQLLWALKNAGSSITLDGDAYDPFVSEAWFKDQALWFLHLGLRGNNDFFRIGDTFRISNPVFSEEIRTTFAMLARFGNYRKESAWLYNEWEAIGLAANSEAAYMRAFDFLYFDQNDAAADERSPQDANVSRQQLFDPPGAAVYQSRWDKPQGTTILLTCPQWYYRGHQELDRLGLQICCRKDMVLLARGYYHTNDANADYGGPHNNAWSKQSISHSGVPLCDDGTSLPHVNFSADSGLTSYPSGEGGQYWKTIGTKRDPNNVEDMRNDAASAQPTNAWLAVEGVTAGKGLELLSPANDPSVAVYYANIRRAYLKEATDLDGGSERLRLAEAKLMVIKDQGADPMILRVVRLQSRLASMLKQDPWNFWGNPLLRDFDTLGRLGALGYLADKNVAGGAQCMVFYHQWSALRVEQIGGGVPISGNTTYGDHWFFYNPNDGSGGANYPPSGAFNTLRHSPDIGRYRVAVKPRVQQVEDYFVCLIVPTPVSVNAEDPDFSLAPAFTWIDDPNYFGVSFPDGKVYKLHKTQAAYLSPADPVDITPPGPPTGLVPTLPASQTVQLAWNQNAEPDLNRYRIYRRIKV